MALLFCDSFDHYTGSAPFLLKWNTLLSDDAIKDAQGRGNTSCLSLRRGDGVAACTKAVNNLATVIVGFAFQINTNQGTSDGTPRILEFRQGGTVHVYVEVDHTLDQVRVYRGDGVQLGSGSQIVNYDSWYYLEAKVTIDNVVGAYEVRINGVSIVSGTAVDTQNTANAYVDDIRLNQYHEEKLRVEDFYICDTTGSQNNDFLGDVRVEAILPNGAGTTTQWNVFVGPANYEDVDEASPDSDTTYVYESVVGEKDTYSYADITPTSANIKGVAVWGYARKDDVGSRSISLVARSAGTESDSPSKSLSDSFTYEGHIWETDPATGIAWTVAGVNGAEFGVKVTA